MRPSAEKRRERRRFYSLCQSARSRGRNPRRVEAAISNARRYLNVRVRREL